MPSVTFRALWHLAVTDRRAWKTRAHWYNGVEYALGGGVALVIAILILEEPLQIIVTALLGVFGAPLLLWLGTIAYKWTHPEARFRSILTDAKPGVPTTHGETRPVGQQPVGDPWWQIAYPDGTESDWFQRHRYAGLAIQKDRAGGFNFDFDRRGQEGVFTIRFRGRIRQGDPPVPLAEDSWRFTDAGGWSRI